MAQEREKEEKERKEQERQEQKKEEERYVASFDLSYLILFDQNF
jgi:ribosomal protein L12E/L44/L45/RPP1/RPP2